MNKTKKASRTGLMKKKAWSGVLKIDTCAAAKQKIILWWPNLRICYIKPLDNASLVNLNKKGLAMFHCLLKSPHVTNHIVHNLFLSGLIHTEFSREYSSACGFSWYLLCFFFMFFEVNFTGRLRNLINACFNLILRFIALCFSSNTFLTYSNFANLHKWASPVYVYLLMLFGWVLRFLCFPRLTLSIFVT